MIHNCLAVKVYLINVRRLYSQSESLSLCYDDLKVLIKILMNNFDVLEERIVQLLNKLKENHLLINQLQSDKKELDQESGLLKARITELKKENESLRMANSLLGSKESKAITKRKINSLIREVDFCIHQLSEIR